MQNMKVYKILLLFAAISFCLFAGAYLMEQNQFTGPFLISALVGLAIAVRGYHRFKGFSYSIMILSAVTISLYYPQYFIGIGGFQFKLLIVPLLQIIMFGMGSQMSLSDFVGIIKMPKGVIAGVICQFSIMPIIGISVATLFKFAPEIAAGIVLVGSSPSGMASNVMSFIAKANLALSVTLTAFATLLSPLMTPFLMKVFAGQLIEIDFWNMMTGIFNMVILPICAGLIFNLFSQGFSYKKTQVIQLASFLGVIFLKSVINYFTAAHVISVLLNNYLWDILLFAVAPVMMAFVFKILAKGNKELLDNILSFVSMTGIGLIITIITAAGRDSLLEVGLLLIAACFLHNIFGYSLGYGVSKLLKLKEQDCRTIALEVGMQNGGLASGLALQMGKVATVGLAPAIFGPLMNITGSSLATWWRGRSLKQSK
ncbi:bile acid:sodium symporter family protein [Saccharicrinis sp. GN24d3]|uniref:bile acid:sodium symporter family protein n=1 Tax=Saccharicrinis sp. GN24d3 TaxID=3458416 RepID=UPI004035CDA9